MYFQKCFWNYSVLLNYLVLSHYQLVKSEQIDNDLCTKVLKATFKHKFELGQDPPNEFKEITLYFKLSEE